MKKEEKQMKTAEEYHLQPQTINSLKPTAQMERQHFN